MIVSTLVADAFYLSLYDKKLQPAIEGGDMSWGLDTLNFIFDEWRDLIPYPVEYSFDSQEDLIGTPFVQVDNVSYVFPGDTVKYPMKSRDLTRFIEQDTIINLKGIPFIYYFDPLKQNIDIYPKTAQPGFRFIVWGRAAIGPLMLSSQIPTNVPIYMVNALKYELAYRLAAELGVTFNPAKDDIRKKLLLQLKSKRQIPLSTPRQNVFGLPSSRNVSPFPYFFYLSGGGA